MESKKKKSSSKSVNNIARRRYKEGKTKKLNLDDSDSIPVASSSPSGKRKEKEDKEESTEHPRNTKEIASGTRKISDRKATTGGADPIDATLDKHRKTSQVDIYKAVDKNEDELDDKLEAGSSILDTFLNKTPSLESKKAASSQGKSEDDSTEVSSGADTASASKFRHQSDQSSPLLEPKRKHRSPLLESKKKRRMESSSDSGSDTQGILKRGQEEEYSGSKDLLLSKFQPQTGRKTKRVKLTSAFNWT
ncbi:MAG: hypothetical protein Q9179_007672 [Wetmoreana sp. 5 TL-2023]